MKLVMAAIFQCLHPPHSGLPVVNLLAKPVGHDEAQYLQFTHVPITACGNGHTHTLRRQPPPDQLGRVAGRFAVLGAVSCRCKLGALCVCVCACVSVVLPEWDRKAELMENSRLTRAPAFIHAFAPWMGGQRGFLALSSTTPPCWQSL